MKLRLVQSLPGRSFTRVDFFAPPDEVWRTILRFLEKGFGTIEERYKRRELNQTFTDCREALAEVARGNTAPATAAEGRRKFRSAAADSDAGHARYPNSESIGITDRRRRKRQENCARRIFAAASLAGNHARKRRTVFRSATDRARA